MNAQRESIDVRWKWLILIAVVVFVLYMLGSSLTPFIVAALFAYLFNPLVERFERWGMSRTLAVSLLFVLLTLVFAGILIGLVPLIERQISNFLGQLPKWIDWFRGNATPWFRDRLGMDVEIPDLRQITDMLQQYWKEAGGVAATVVAKVSKSGLAIVGWMLNLVIIPVAAFYLMRDWDLLVDRVHALIPRSVEPTVSRLARESDKTLSSFLRGQLSVMIILGLIYGIGLWMVGISVGPLIGMIAGLISFVPYMGAIVGLAMGVIAAVVQYQDFFHIAMVALVFVIGQTLEGYVLVPKMVGDSIGLHPVAVMFAILAGGELFGFVGVLVALPVAAVAMVVLRYLYDRYTESELYQRDAGAGKTVIVDHETPTHAQAEIESTGERVIIVDSAVITDEPKAQ
ncbi:MAG: AI-2E family transporter [Dokdonella sp.]